MTTHGDLIFGPALLLLLPLALACSSSRPAASPTLLVTPSPVLRGDPVAIRAEGLTPGARVTLAAAGKDQHGQYWRSRTTFLADAVGTVDVSRDAPPPAHTEP
jgi:hypothetical protein